jgi:hypothetical protein
MVLGGNHVSEGRPYETGEQLLKRILLDRRAK